MKYTQIAVTVLALAVVAPPLAAALEPPQSPRLVRAKDHIADEQWERAIEQLRAAVADTRERARDEALFWLAHSQNQVRDYKGGIETILALEKQYPKSAWVKPAQSLRIEIAQKLQATDVLWFTVRPNGAFGVQAAQPSEEPRRVSGRSTTATTRAGSGARGSGAAASPRAGVHPAEPVVTVSPGSAFLFSEGWSPDSQQRILALGSLMQTDAAKVIPILKDIALESPDPNEASRALFVLAQSGRPEAYTSVLEVARQGSELVQIAAVRELGRFGGPKMTDELLKVYSSSAPRVKYQVVNSLGERRATTALMQIVQRESDQRLQETAILRLGQSGGPLQLRQFYDKASARLKRPIIIGLFNAGAEEELIAIAEREQDPSIRREALTRLRLLNSARARAYIEKREQNR